MQSNATSIISATVKIALSEEEARALHAISVYGIRQFLDVFYTNLGKSYLEPHEDGLKSLFESMEPLKKQLERIDKAREAFNEQETV